MKNLIFCNNTLRYYLYVYRIYKHINITNIPYVCVIYMLHLFPFFTGKNTCTNKKLSTKASFKRSLSQFVSISETTAVCLFRSLELWTAASSHPLRGFDSVIVTFTYLTLRLMNCIYLLCHNVCYIHSIGPLFYAIPYFIF